MKNRHFPLIIILFLLITNASGLTSTSKKWLVNATEHFIVYYQQEDRQNAKSLINEAEIFYNNIIADIGSAPKTKITVYISPSEKLFRELQLKGYQPPDWVIGVAYSNNNLIILKSPRVIKEGHIKLLDVFKHELSHVILKSVLKESTIPLWLNEGLAMYEAKEGNLQITAIISKVSLTNSFIPFSQITNSFPQDKSSANTAYAQSFSFISFIINDFGKNSLTKIIDRLSKGDNIEQAIFNSFNLSLTQLEKKWQRFVRIRYTWIPIFTSALSLWFLISLLALTIYYKKKRKMKKKLEEWENEKIYL